MSQPPPGWSSGEPPDLQHGGWQQQQPAQGPSGWAPPEPAQYGWGAQQPMTPQQQPDGTWSPAPQGYGAPPPPKPRGRGKLIGSAVVVVALAAGGVTAYVAMNDSNSSGASSPRDAVQSIVSDLNNSDLIGVLDDLAPGERDALANPVLDEIKQLKRLKVLQKNADPSSVSGVKLKVDGLTFADKTVAINDRVQIVQVTGGTLDVSADAAKIPFTHDFLEAAFPDGLPTASNQTQHIDIAKIVRENRDNRPIRIATQKSGGKWYPSIFYTIADRAADNEVPTAADAIAAEGGSSPRDVVTKMINALIRQDATGAIKLLSPDELAAVHDYGGLLVRAAGAGGGGSADITLKDLQLKTEPISGGATRVTLSSVTVVSAGDESTVKVDGSCVDATVKGEHKRMCAADIANQLISFLDSFGVSAHVTAAQRQAIENLLTGFTKVGVDTTQSGGKWYVNPARSFLDVTSSVLSGLQGNDLLELVRFFASLGH